MIISHEVKDSPSNDGIISKANWFLQNSNLSIKMSSLAKSKAPLLKNIYAEANQITTQINNLNSESSLDSLTNTILALTKLISRYPGIQFDKLENRQVQNLPLNRAHGLLIKKI